MPWQASPRLAALLGAALLLIAAQLSPAAAASGRGPAAVAASQMAPTVEAGVAGRFDDPVAYCRAVGTIDKPDSRYDGPPVPAWLARALRRASHAAATAPLGLFDHAVWRCAHGHVLACTYGANIPCDSKADTSRWPAPGAVNFCRDSPEAEVVPAAATGHATVYEWRCHHGKPKIVRQVLRVDREGYPAAFWYRVTPAMGRP
ncbi:MAG TPA: hypothetical protein VKY65_20165 [Alphaproteobacteria bacterium]|nr:hypothetical protein [Alphaproteobacteria bacterium]